MKPGTKVGNSKNFGGSFQSDRIRLRRYYRIFIRFDDETGLYRAECGGEVVLTAKEPEVIQAVADLRIKMDAGANAIKEARRRASIFPKSSKPREPKPDDFGDLEQLEADEARTLQRYVDDPESDPETVAGLSKWAGGSWWRYLVSLDLALKLSGVGSIKPKEVAECRRSI